FGDGTGDAGRLGVGVGWGARRVDQGDQRQAESFGQAVGALRLAVPAGPSPPHAQAVSVLGHHHNGSSAETADGCHHRVVVIALPVTADLEDVRKDGVGECSAAWAIRMTSELNRFPDVAARLRMAVRLRALAFSLSAGFA